MKRRLLAVVTAIALTAIAVLAPGPTADADPIVIPDLIDVEDDQSFACLELVPHAISLENVPTSLEVRILLDGVAQSVAEEAVADMRVAYEPLDITVVPSYQPVSFSSNDAPTLNQSAKDVFGGSTPPGVDVVYTMTSKDITADSPTGDNVAGLADCIGGIRFDDRAFAVGEVIPDGPASLLGIPLPGLSANDTTGKTMAHEIGHLLGAHHHYFSVEGLLADDPNVGTLMGPVLTIVSLRFSTVNSLMARAHMELYG